MHPAHPPRRVALAAALLFSIGGAFAQTVPPAPGPDGRNPAAAQSPAATATSPNTLPGPAATSRAPNGPAPEVRSTAPGTTAAPQGLSTNTLGVPLRIAPPDAPDQLRDPVDPTTAVAPSAPSRILRRPPAAPTTPSSLTPPSTLTPPTAPAAAPAPVPTTPPLVR